MTYDLIIVGGGPAGISAGVYAARKKIKFLLATETLGGQSAVASEIQNWIGIKSISGFELAKKMEEHLMAHEGIEVEEGYSAEKVEKTKNGFIVVLKNGKSFETKTILATTGGRRRRLGVTGEKDFENKGVAYCSTCDAPMYAKKTVAIVGGGNAALGAAKDLSVYADKVYLLVRSENIKGDSVPFEEIKKDPKIEILLNSEVTEVFGHDFVEGVKYLDKKDSETKELKLDGVFVEIGSVPNSEFLGDLAKKNNYNEVIVDHGNQKTSCEGIWAAGDITDLPYKQNNISASDGIKAVLSINEFLRKGK
ncbi:MAG: FAD-dependent oxidoreductase [bacterium]|nr:FAD-dependent oxidoreductase [bacterium]